LICQANWQNVGVKNVWTKNAANNADLADKRLVPWGK